MNSSNKIPKGNNKEDRDERVKIIRQALKQLNGKEIVCPALGNVPVKITSMGINETAFHASKSYLSTLAAIDVENQIKTAQFSRYHLPKPGGQAQKHNFAFTIELKGIIEDRPTKLYVGVLITAKYMHYCITAQ